MLDAYTEGPGTTQGLSDSEKFKEGYVKKGKGKVKNPPKKTVEVSSWMSISLKGSFVFVLESSFDSTSI